MQKSVEVLYVWLLESLLKSIFRSCNYRTLEEVVSILRRCVKRFNYALINCSSSTSLFLFLSVRDWVSKSIGGGRLWGYDDWIINNQGPLILDNLNVALTLKLCMYAGQRALVIMKFERRWTIVTVYLYRDSAWFRDHVGLRYRWSSMLTVVGNDKGPYRFIYNLKYMLMVGGTRLFPAVPSGPHVSHRVASVAFRLGAERSHNDAIRNPWRP